jgi:hypothetical protein
LAGDTLNAGTTPRVSIAIAGSAAVMDEGFLAVATLLMLLSATTFIRSVGGDVLAKHNPKHEFAGKLLSVHVPSANEVLARY